jgi:hypothetical protein
MNITPKNTHPVSEDVLRTVHDSSAALPRSSKWLTSYEDVRKTL